MRTKYLLLIILYTVSERSFSQTAPSVAGEYTIAGISDISAGQGTKLSVMRGNSAIEANWTWYVNRCGGAPIATGSSLLVSPAQTTTYYARGQGMSNCISKTVHVNNNSVPPDEIMGTDMICVGDNRKVQLTVLGGILGKGAKWVWFEGNCNTRKIGEGASITVTPNQTTAYFVRAEGGTNITECRSFKVNVIELSEMPAGIAGPAAVCLGQAFDLTIEGGRLSSGAEWVWYKGNATNKILLGKGRTLKDIQLTESSTFFVTAEGQCGETNYISKNVIMNVPAIKSAAIKMPASVEYNDVINLEITGYSSADKSNLVWYENSCTNGKKIGVGEKITYKVTKKTAIFVKDIGECPENDCITAVVEPLTSGLSKIVTFVNVGFANNNFSDLNSFSNLSLSVGGGGKLGWYGRIKIPVNQTRSIYETDNSGLTNYDGNGYYEFNGRVLNKRFGATAGIVYTQKPFSVYMGAGYGSRNLEWGITEFSYENNEERGKAWAKNIKSSFNGAEFEGGFLIRIGFINVLAGIGTIDFKYMDAHAGIGFNIN